ncbi:MAG: hypothetical protein ACKVTZ_08440 [Bacteroidia bacterium]
MRRSFALFSLLSLALSFFIFHAIHQQYIDTDIQEHINAAIAGEIPANFAFFSLIYYPLKWLNLLTFTNGMYCATLILTLSVWARFAVTTYLLQKSKIPAAWADIIAFLLAHFAFSLPRIGILFNTLQYFKHQITFEYYQFSPYWFGQFPPFVWHNSTLILLYPFALLLFWQSYEQLQRPSSTRLLTIIALVCLNIIIKPSFFFCFAGAYPLFLLKNFRLSRTFFLQLLPVIVGLFLLWFQMRGIYHTETANSGLGIKPFAEWAIHLGGNHFPLRAAQAIFCSFLFPICFFAVYPSFLSEQKHQYTLLLLAGAMLLAILMGENGERAGHGNFLWQMFVCNYLLFGITVSDFWKQLNINALQKREKGLLFALALHLGSGGLYLVKLITLGTFA